MLCYVTMFFVFMIVKRYCLLFLSFVFDSAVIANKATVLYEMHTINKKHVTTKLGTRLRIIAVLLEISGIVHYLLFIFFYFSDRITTAIKFRFQLTMFKVQKVPEKLKRLNVRCSTRRVSRWLLPDDRTD